MNIIQPEKKSHLYVVGGQNEKKKNQNGSYRKSVGISWYRVLFLFSLRVSSCPSHLGVLKPGSQNVQITTIVSSRAAYHILMVRVIDPTAFHEQYVSVVVLLQHFYGGHGHLAERRLVFLHSFSARVRHMAHREQTWNHADIRILYV